MFLSGKEESVLNFSHLTYVVTVAKAGSISRACKELLVSQPYLSGVIKNVEDELGIQIFQRTSTGVALTEAGEAFMQSSERILSEWQILQSLRESSGDRLKIVSYYSYFFLRCFLNMRTAGGSLSQDSFKEMPLVDCFRALSSEKANLGLVCYADIYADYYHKMAASYQCRMETLFPSVAPQVMMRPGHPLSIQSRVTVPELLQYPMVCYKDAAPLLKRLGIGQHPDLLLVTDRGTYLEAMENGDYISINSIIIDKAYSNQRFSFVPLEGSPFGFEFSYAVRDRYRMNGRERKFLRLVRSMEKKALEKEK